MEEGYLGEEYLKEKLENLLGVTLVRRDTPVKPGLEKEKAGFIYLVNTLQDLVKKENVLQKRTGVDFSTLFDPYWDVIGEMMVNGVGENTTTLVWWYLFEAKEDRYNLELQDGSKVKIKTPNDLFDFLQDN